MQRKQQVGDEQNLVHSEIGGSNDGALLRGHWDCGIDVVVGPVQWVNKEEQPEADHRQEMTEDRAARGCGNDVVRDGDSKRRDVEAHSIVNPEAAKRCAPRTGNELRHEIANRIGKHREDNAADDVPGTDIQIGEPSFKKWQDKLEDHQNEGKDDENDYDESKLR